MPTVSIIVPNYNHAQFLRQRIDSILAQTYQDFELILLDDCSTDGSREILRQYASNPHVTRVEFNETNSGSTFRQWNKGVRLASGKYVWIAESDDYADPRLLETLVARLESDPSAVMAQCRTWRVSADGAPMGFQDERLPNIGSDKWTKDFRADAVEECRKNLRPFAVQNASSIVFRRDVYWLAGGADESLRQCGDWKTWAAMALTGGTVLYVAEPLNYRRNHEACVTEKNMLNPHSGLWAYENVHVAAWIINRVEPEPDDLARMRDELAAAWVPALLNLRIPLKIRRAILRDALSIEPHALRRLPRAAAAKLYQSLLEVTYGPRHAVGLCRSRTAQVRANDAR